ncbi:MAG: hypothetical protein KF915_20395 [Polyangiaceae bacterium]|nr:hypothetical protein [Polyangiaceae bacterium]
MTRHIEDLTEQELLELEADEAALSELFASASEEPPRESLHSLEQLAGVLPSLDEALEAAHAGLAGLPAEEEPSEAAFARMMAFAGAVPEREAATFAARQEPELRELFDAHQEPLSVEAEARLMAHARGLGSATSKTAKSGLRRWLAPGVATAAAAALALFIGLGQAPTAGEPIAAAGAYPTPATAVAEVSPSAEESLGELSAEDELLLGSSQGYEEDDSYALLSLAGLNVEQEDAELEALLGALSTVLEESSRDR